MAVVDPDEPVAVNNAKHNRTARGQRKLLVNERVEVRSVEEGFCGSWHSGIVIACNRRGHRHVRYDHLLADDECGKLVDDVTVSPLLDAIDLGDPSFSNYRGNIRPPPPPVKFQNWGLPYGLCVDAFYNDAWWEGVIFDHDDGSPERSVFFPDLGDEMEMSIHLLRITQDWNEVTERWTRRGFWIFLELIEDYEQEISCLPVSVKQIWYDVRDKNDFKKAEWTSDNKHLWKKMVSEVIGDNLKITVKELCPTLEFSGSSFSEIQAESESAQLDKDVNMDPEVELVHSNGVSAVDDLANSDTVVDHGAIVRNGSESAQPGTGVKIVPRADLVNSCAIAPFDNPLSIEIVNKNGAIMKDVYGCRGRIINDSFQKCEMAACLGSEMRQLTPIVDCNTSNLNLSAVSNISHHEKALCVTPQALSMSPSNDGGNSSAGSVSRGVKGVLSNSSDKISGKHKQKACQSTANWQPVSLNMLPGAECCPIAVDEYYLHSCEKLRRLKSRSCLRRDVWKHLLYLGWKFEASNDKGIPRKRYKSPDGLCLYSLFQVCKHLKKSTRDTSSLATPDDPRRLPAFSNVSLRLEQPQQSPNPDCSLPQTVVFPYFIEDTKPDICPQPIMEYYQVALKKPFPKKAKDLIPEVKKLLTAVGWMIKERYYQKHNRKTLMYESPTGRVYDSLRRACAAYLKEEISRNTVSTCRLTKSLNSTEETEGFSTSNTPSFMSSGLDSQENLVQPNTLTDRLQNGLKKNGKLSRPKDLNSTLPKVKRRKKTGALIKSRDGKNDIRPTRVLRSSKRVQEVVNPSSSHRNPRTILSWLIDNNALLPRAKVHYLCGKDKHPMAEGRITRDGIKCSCCLKVFTLREFEHHAHSNNSGPSPTANIFLEDGRSLLDCQMQIIHNWQSSTRESCDKLKSNWHRGENDYICSVCHYGGELMLCDQCPSSFHKSCLGLQDIPDGDWFCPSCCCGICGESKFQKDKEHTKDGNILVCSQCERKYHVGCLSDGQPTELENSPVGNWFCTEKCKQIFLGLQKLLGKSFTVGADNLTWCLLKSMKTDSSGTNSAAVDALMDNYSKLSVALGVMHECFEPVKEPHTRRDLVEDIIFNRGSDLKRLDVQGFYTVVLVRNDELITVATVRVYGQKVAEVPLVGTRFQYRRLGMCRILMNELEKKLMELGVERLVLPAVPSVLNTWTTSFGFSQMTASERLQFLDYTFLDFQDTIMCQKILMKIPSAAELRPLKGVQPKFHDDIHEGGNNIDLDRSSAMSEVYQAEQIEDRQIVDQEQLEISADNNSDSNNRPTDMVMVVKQAQKPEFRPCVSKSSRNFSMTAANLKRASNPNFYSKCYKRRNSVNVSHLCVN